MTTTTVDFNALLRDAKTAGQALPDGEYDFEITDATVAVAQTGNPYVKAKMRVASGPHANVVVKNNFVLVVDNPQALQIWFRHMNALGVGPEFFSQIGTGSAEAALTPVANAIRGRRGRMKLSKREWPASPPGTPDDQRSWTNQVDNITGTGLPAGAVAPPLPGGGVPGVPGVPGMTPGVPTPLGAGFGVAVPVTPGSPGLPPLGPPTGVPAPLAPAVAQASPAQLPPFNPVAPTAPPVAAPPAPPAPPAPVYAPAPPPAPVAASALPANGQANPFDGMSQQEAFEAFQRLMVQQGATAAPPVAVPPPPPAPPV